MIMSNSSEFASFFDASVSMGDSVERLVLNSAQEMTERAVIALAAHYKFDAQEALALLNLSSAKVVRKVEEKSAKREKPEKREKPAKEASDKWECPFPYSGTCDDSLCHGLLQNQQQYTQCKKSPVNGGEFCKMCQKNADENDGIPEYGTIELRQAVDIFEYITPKGRKPLAFAKVMRKYSVTKEQVLEEAGKLNIEIDERHFEEPVKDAARGRPKAEKPAKAANVTKGVKGRPKKEKKVLEVEGEEEDLFAALVADAASQEAGNEMVDNEEENNESDADEEGEEEEAEIEEIVFKPSKKEEAAKEALRLQKEEEKAAKEAARLQKEQEKTAKEAARLQKEQEKAAKEQEKAAKEQEKAAKKSKKAEKPASSDEEDAEPDVVKKIEFGGKKYLKSKKTGIIYDYKQHTENGEQVMVGKWNESKNRVDFTPTIEDSDEEEETTEYEEDDV